MMAFLFWHQILELEHLALARRHSGIFWPLLAFEALRGKIFLEKACSLLRALDCSLQAFSDFVSSILLDFRHHTCGFSSFVRESGWQGLEAASEQNMTFVRSQQELTLF